MSAAIDEVRALHRFFEDWFHARLSPTDADFARLPASLAPDFVLVPPSGTPIDHAALLTSLRSAHGSRAGDEAFRIWIESPATRPLAADLTLVTYEEWQETRDGRGGRLSSALLRTSNDAPGGFLWEHVHETWLPGSSA